MAKRVSPQEKKELDYDKQRRFHHNNDKSARKWVPARKARLSRAARRDSKEILMSAVNAVSEIDSLDDQVSSGLLMKVAPREYFSKDGSESLREHVQHQLERKNSIPAEKPPVRRVPGCKNYFMEPYVRERDHRLFMTHMRLWLKKSTKTNEHTRRFAKEVKSCIEGNTPFFAGFFQDEPSWRPRLLKWADRILG